MIGLCLHIYLYLEQRVSTNLLLYGLPSLTQVPSHRHLFYPRDSYLIASPYMNHGVYGHSLLYHLSTPLSFCVGGGTVFVNKIAPPPPPPINRYSCIMYMPVANTYRKSGKSDDRHEGAILPRFGDPVRHWVRKEISDQEPDHRHEHEQDSTRLHRSDVSVQVRPGTRVSKMIVLNVFSSES